MTLVNDCDGMTLVVGLPRTDKSKDSSWNAPSLLMDLLLKSIGELIVLKSNNHMCHDPRWFFAGAPSACMDHSLASTLQVKANICKRNQKSQYQWHLGELIVLLVIGRLV
jgi:hypothetical protein